MMEHFCKVNEIKINTILLPEEVYTIAKEFHAKNKLSGIIPINIEDAIYLDEKNHITGKATWMVRSVLEDNPFEGMNEITILISDDNKIVCCVLDHNGIPMLNN